MNNQTIECVWCSSKKEFNKFIRDIDKGSTKIVDYTLIKNKLMKSDPYLEEPNDSIVGLNIIYEIRRFLNIETKKYNKLIYFFKNLDTTTVSNFIAFAEEESNGNVQVSLVIIGSCDYPKHGVLNQFENVKFITYD